MEAVSLCRTPGIRFDNRAVRPQATRTHRASNISPPVDATVLDLTPNGKHRIQKRGQPGGKRRGVIITGYSGGGHAPAVPKSERKRIRAEVHQVARDARALGTTPEIQRRYASVSSRVGRIEATGHAEGKRLRRDLLEVWPSVFPKPNRREIYGG